MWKLLKTSEEEASARCALGVHAVEEFSNLPEALCSEKEVDTEHHVQPTLFFVMTRAVDRICHQKRTC